MDDFTWPVNSSFNGPFVIDVEFLDLKIAPVNGGEATHIWPTGGLMQSLSTQSTLRCLSRMLDEGILADISINTTEGSIKAHKAILLANSPVFQSMFSHDLKETVSSTIDIEDMSLESCTALISYLYGTIKRGFLEAPAGTSGSGKQIRHVRPKICLRGEPYGRY